MVETSSNQLPQQGFDKENMIQMPHGFYRQVTHDKQLQAYIFTDNNELVLVETSIYVIFHEPNRRNFRYNPKTMQFRQVRVEECDWTTRYLLYQDIIFHQVPGKTNHVRKNRNGQTPDN